MSGRWTSEVVVRSVCVRFPPPRSQIRDQRRSRNLVYFCLNPEYIITTTVLAIHLRRSARGLRLSSVLGLVCFGCLSLATPFAIDHPFARFTLATRRWRDLLAIKRSDASDVQTSAQKTRHLVARRRITSREARSERSTAARIFALARRFDRRLGSIAGAFARERFLCVQCVRSGRRSRGRRSCVRNCGAVAAALAV